MKAKMAISMVGVLTAAGLVAAGCGSGSGSSGAYSTGSAPSEEKSAATGDIPDNQTFLLFHDPQAGYSIRYPEGWARRGSGSEVTFQENANVIHVSVHEGTPRGKVGVKTIHSHPSAPDPVTGKRLRLVVDRYEYGNGRRVAVLKLSTPVGVDNVDAYRMISESFEWQP